MRNSITILLLFAAAAVSGQTSWLSPTITGQTYNAWAQDGSNPANAYSDNDVRAYLMYTRMPGSQDYGSFGIPDLTGQTINGITVRGEIYNNNSAGTSVVLVELSWNGGASWTATGYQASTATNWTDVFFSLGNNTNLWGRTWTPAELTNANFKVRITSTNGGSIYTTNVDYIQVQIAYSGGTPPVGGKYYFSSSGSDLANGTAPETPKKTQGALETLVPTLDPGDSVFFRRGSVWDDFDINIAVSGAAGARIVFTDYDTGAKPKFLGTDTITGWSQAGNIWSKTDVATIAHKKDNYVDLYNGSGSDHSTFTYLLGNIWVGGVPYYVGRYPNSGPLVAESVDEAGNTWIQDNNASWATNSWQGAEVIVTQKDWIRSKMTVTSNTATRLYVTAGDLYAPDSWWNLDNGTIFAIMNDATTLDQNGEYYLNYASSQLQVYWNTTLPTVQVPGSDSIWSVTGSYITIENLEVVGSRVYGVKVRGGIYNTVQYVTASYCGYAGIYATGSANVTLQNNYAHHSNSNIYTNDCTNQYIGSNITKQAGVEGSLDDYEIQCGVNIFVNEYWGSTIVEKNFADSANYSNILFKDYTSRTSPGFDMYRNFGRMQCMIRTDGADFYSVSNDDNVTKRIRSNIGWISAEKSAWVEQGHTEGIYLDNTSPYVTVDSNLIYDSPSMLFLNYGADYTVANANTGVNFAKSTAQYSEAGLYAERAAGSIGHVTFTNNTVVTPTYTLPASFPAFVHWNGTDNGTSGFTWDCVSCTFSGNKYSTLITNTREFTFQEYWGTEHQMLSLAAWNSGTGMDIGSTVHLTNQFYKVFANWSDVAHVFALSGIWESFTGTTYSTSITIQPYKFIVLWQISGTAPTTVEELHYNYPVTDLGGEEVVPPSECAALAGGTIAASQSSATAFDPAAFTSTVDASGGDGALSYVWESSTTSSVAGVGSWTQHSSNTTTYDVGTTSTTTYWVRRVNDACDPIQTAYSNVLTLTVTASPGGMALYKKGVRRYPIGKIFLPKI